MSNPYIGTADELTWSQGFVSAFVDPSIDVPEIHPPEAPDPFVEGQRDGKQSAIEGIFFEPACFDLSTEHHHDLHLVLDGAHVLEIAEEIITIEIAEAATSAVVFALLLAITLPIHFAEPEDALLPAVEKLSVVLSDMGLPSLELYLGAGLDFEVEGCQLKLTPIFQWEQAAREAAEAFGRPQWFVMRWRSDASGFLTVVANG